MEINSKDRAIITNRAFSLSSSFEPLSASDLEAGSSSASAAYPFPKYPSSYSHSRRNMVGPALRSPRSPRFSFFLSDCDDEGAHHFLDSCHLCKKPIGGGRDIFMYRGDTPFCSEECRQERIEMDEAQEKRIKMAQKQRQRSKSPSRSSKSEKIHVRITSTAVAG